MTNPPPPTTTSPNRLECLIWDFIFDLCHSFYFTSNTSLYLWHCFNMCIFWSACPLRSGFSVNTQDKDFKMWFDDKRGEFKFDSVNFTVLYSKSYFLQGSLRKIHHLAPVLWFPIYLFSDASWQRAVCTVTHDYQHHNTDLCHVDSTTCNLCFPACATSVTGCSSHQHATLRCMLVRQMCVYARACVWLCVGGG